MVSRGAPTAFYSLLSTFSCSLRRSRSGAAGTRTQNQQIMSFLNSISLHLRKHLSARDLRRRGVPS